MKTPFQFKHLTQTECPTCGAGVKRCSINGEHTNGQQFEVAVFDCGYTIEYSPNFSKLVENAICGRSSMAAKITDVREKMIASISRMLSRHKTTITTETLLDLYRELSYIIRHAKIKVQK